MFYKGTDFENALPFYSPFKLGSAHPYILIFPLIAIPAIMSG